MKFPAGTDGGTISNPQDEGFVQELTTFRGAIEIETGAGHGLILTDNGTLVSAYFRTGEGAFKGNDALSRMTSEQGEDEAPQTFSLRKYDEQEFSQAVRISRDEDLLLPGSGYNTAPAKRAPGNPGPLRNSWTRASSGRLRASPGSLRSRHFLKGSRYSR